MEQNTFPLLDAMPGDARIDVPALACVSSLAESSIRTWLCRAPERLPRAVRFGRKVLFRVADVRAWLAQAEV
jgi:predicted DNA-binding transcriptional regulator AlpA